MRPAVTNKALTSPTGWQEMAQGEWLKSRLEHAISPMLRKFFGYYLLALGPLAGELDLTSAQVRQVIHAHQWDGADLRTHISQLPLQANSVDACVLPFCLDYSSDPHQLLREAHRVVIAEGHLLVAGFNPYSLLLAGKLLPGHQHKAPWNGRSFSSHRLKDWLQLLGCEIMVEQNLVWSSLLGSSHPSELGQHWGNKLAPFMATAYVVLAKKREVPLTPAKPVWKRVAKLKSVGVLSGAGVAGRA